VSHATHTSARQGRQRQQQQQQQCCQWMPRQDGRVEWCVPADRPLLKHSPVQLRCCRSSLPHACNLRRASTAPQMARAVRRSHFAPAVETALARHSCCSAHAVRPAASNR
jgi:hypothetical protein